MGTITVLNKNSQMPEIKPEIKPEDKPISKDNTVPQTVSTQNKELSLSTKEICILSFITIAILALGISIGSFFHKTAYGSPTYILKNDVKYKLKRLEQKINSEKSEEYLDAAKINKLENVRNILTNTIADIDNFEKQINNEFQTFSKSIETKLQTNGINYKLSEK